MNRWLPFVMNLHGCRGWPLRSSVLLVFTHLTSWKTSNTLSWLVIIIMGLRCCHNLLSLLLLLLLLIEEKLSLRSLMSGHIPCVAAWISSSRAAWSIRLHSWSDSLLVPFALDELTTYNRLLNIRVSSISCLLIDCLHSFFEIFRIHLSCRMRLLDIIKFLLKCWAYLNNFIDFTIDASFLKNSVNCCTRHTSVVIRLRRLHLEGRKHRLLGRLRLDFVNETLRRWTSTVFTRWALLMLWCLNFLLWVAWSCLLWIFV